MSGVAPTFRLLDARVGWDPRPGDGLAGVDLDTGALRVTPPAAPLATPGTRLLARSYDGTWWLAGRRGLRRLGPCDDAFCAWASRRRIIDLAVRGRRVAVVLADGRVEALDIATGRTVAAAHVPRATRADLDRCGGLLVTTADGRRVWLDPSGLPCRADPPCRPGDPIPPTPEPRPWPVDIHADEHGFTLGDRGSFDWRGHRATGPLVKVADPEVRGQYLSAPLDSGIPGCRWHRIRIDADLPEGTRLEVAFATTDGPVDGRTPPQATADQDDFPAGDPHPLDWVEVLPGALDSTLRTPPGRTGYLRLRLVARGSTTPVVHQVRLDLPRATSLARLPAAYSDDPDARDFTERFLSVADAQVEEMDEVLARRSALLDADALPDDALGWLAGLLGTGFETQMSVANRRALLRAAPDLFRRRGTPGGLVDTLAVALGVTCTVEELGTTRPWGALGRAHLGSVRLFSRSTTRVRLDTSRLGSARLEGRGAPDLDAVLAGAYRIRVHVPAGTDTGLVEKVVRSQIPAHVVCSVEAAAAGLAATTMRLGIDTTLLPPAAAVVGDLSLGRRGVVRAGRAAGTPLVVGRPVAARPRAHEGKEMECPC